MRQEWLASGAHVNAVGSSIPTAASSTPRRSSPAALFADRRESVENEAGDFLLAAAEEAGLGPEHIRAELGELLVGRGGRTADADDELTVFKSLGLAVEDLAAAALCVERARRDGIGVEVDF